MPQVPYSPVPSNAPSTSVPSDYFTQQASPADFGAQVGQATEKLGSTLGQAADMASQQAISWQTVVNNVAADAAFNQFQDQNQKILYGDPNDPSKPGYFGTHGEAAVNGKAATLQALNDARQGISDGLANQNQRLAFDEASRRLQMNSMSGIGSHYDTEFTRYGTEVQTAAIDLKARAVANGYNDDNLFQHNLADAGRAADAKSALATGHLVPGSQAEQDIFADNRMQAEQTLYRARAVAMGTANPAAGLAFVQAHSTAFDAITLHQLTDEFKGGARSQQIAGGINQTMASPLPAAGATPSSATVDQLSSAFQGQEGTGTSVQGAVAGIMPATFKQFAQPGEDIDKPGDNAVVRQRMIAKYAADYDGDPARVAVALFSGPGNVAPVGSPTPWLSDNKDATGTSTSGYVAGFLGRIPPSEQPGGTGPPDRNPAPYGVEFQRMQQAWTNARRLFPNDLAAQRQMAEGVWQQIQQTNTLQAKYEAEQAKATRDAQQAAGKTFLSQIDADPKSLDMAALEKSPLSWEQRNDLYNIAQTRLKETAMGRDAMEHGPGFWPAYQAVHSTDLATKISDPSQLWARGGPNGDLTLPDIKQLTTEIEGTRTPEGKSEGEIRTQNLAAAHIAISGHGVMGGARDAIGEANFGRYLTVALPELDAMRGKLTPAQIWAKDGPMEQLKQQFMRTPAQLSADMLGQNNPDLAVAGGQPGTPAPAKAAVDLSTVPGIVSAYKSGYFGLGPAAYDKAAAELQKRGLAKPPAAAPSAPTNE